MKFFKVISFFFLFFMIPFFVYAEDSCDLRNISIQSISLTDNSSSTSEVLSASVEDETIHIGLKMMNVKDYAEYTLSVKNDSNEDYVFDDNNLVIDNPSLSYQFEYPDHSNIIKAKSEKDILLRIEYVKEINDFHNTKTGKITLPLSQKKIASNPKTYYNLLIVLGTILVLSLLFVVSRKKKQVFIFFIIGLFLTPFIVFGTCRFQITVDSKIELYNINKSVSFAEDSWETISEVAKSGNACDIYQIGDTKTINIGEYGEHTVRIANCSRPEECDREDFSQTACGFVLEFADTITDHRMNPDTLANEIGDGNNGGWPACEMRTFLSDHIYNVFPDDLKKVIIDTKVVSGYGINDSSNFVSTDKLYLLAGTELCSSLNDADTAREFTRKLDIYQNNDSCFDISPRKEPGYWWLRSISSNSSTFMHVKYGYHLSLSGNGSVSSSCGVSPAFRIG